MGPQTLPDEGVIEEGGKERHHAFRRSKQQGRLKRRPQLEQ